MKEIQKQIQENIKVLKELVGEHIDKLSIDPVKNHKKIVEVCHVGKFLMLLGNGYRIERLSEGPDFILKTNESLVGLEHQIIIDSKRKEYEGFFENIFKRAESLLNADHDLPNFHSNCYLKCDLPINIGNKDKLIQEVRMIVRHFILTKEFLQNSIIEDIDSMPHDQKSISPNFGSWWVKELESEILNEAILHKEGKISIYAKNSVATQWLLLVIGGLNESSYEMNQNLRLEIQTAFDKVYILEDFKSKLYELK